MDHRTAFGKENKYVLMWYLIFAYSLYAFIQLMVTIMIKLLEIIRGLIS